MCVYLPAVHNTCGQGCSWSGSSHKKINLKGSPKVLSRQTSQFGWDLEKEHTQPQVCAGQSLAVKPKTPRLISAKEHDLVAV